MQREEGRDPRRWRLRGAHLELELALGGKVHLGLDKVLDVNRDEHAVRPHGELDGGLQRHFLRLCCGPEVVHTASPLPGKKGSERLKVTRRPCCLQALSQVSVLLIKCLMNISYS